jgi:AcrR family transcriptional regulator
MRITLQAKAENRARILQAAKDLFAGSGYEATTTRDIARAAGIATGTLFNYFPTKEQIVAALAGEAVTTAHQEFNALTPPPHNLAERLFALVARELRHLRPYRTILRPVLDLDRGDSSESDNGATAADFRVQHAAAVERVLAAELGDDPGPLAMRLYWTLYTGVLTAWTADDSPHQEQTLALLDQSIRMYVSWLRAPREPAVRVEGGGLRVEGGE